MKPTGVPNLTLTMFLDCFFNQGARVRSVICGCINAFPILCFYWWDFGGGVFCDRECDRDPEWTSSKILLEFLFRLWGRKRVIATLYFHITLLSVVFSRNRHSTDIYWARVRRSLDLIWGTQWLSWREKFLWCKQNFESLATAGCMRVSAGTTPDRAFLVT